MCTTSVTSAVVTVLWIVHQLHNVGLLVYCIYCDNYKIW